MGMAKILDEIAKDSIYAKGVAAVSLLYCCDIFKEQMLHGSVLELGPAEGLMTKILYQDAQKFAKWSQRGVYSVVEGSSIFAQALQETYPELDVHACLFEEFEAKMKYENIILGHVLEHVENPAAVLKQCGGEWIADGGRIFAAVPNARSIHRQAAVKMGLLDSVYDFSEKDKRHGHRRVLDWEMFQDLFVQAGFKIIKQGGYWLKPLSDSQIEKDWTKEMIEAFLMLGEEYPKIAGEIYLIAEK